MRRLLALFSVFAIACGGDSSTAPEPTILGAWSLRTINGTALPFVVELKALTNEELEYGEPGRRT